MQRHPTAKVYKAVLRELDVRFQRYYHQSLTDIVQDLEIRNTFRSPKPTPHNVLSTIYHTGLLQMNSSTPVAEIRDVVARCVQGTYGSCSRCGRSISNRELERNPMLSLCALCRSHAKQKAS